MVSLVFLETFSIKHKTVKYSAHAFRNEIFVFGLFFAAEKQINILDLFQFILNHKKIDAKEKTI